MTPDSNQSSSNQGTASNLQDSAKLLEQLMSQQEVKNPELAAKQARLIQLLSKDSTSETPAA